MLHYRKTAKPENRKTEYEIMGIGMQEILVLALIILLLFGGKKIPELMKGLGKGVKSFKDGMNGKIEDEPEAPKKKDE